MKIRTFRQEPFAWQSKEAFRIIRKRVPQRQWSAVRSVYVALTEIASDRSEEELSVFLMDIKRYTGLDDRTIRTRLNTLQQLRLVDVSRQTRNTDGKYTSMTIYITCVDDADGNSRTQLVGNMRVYRNKKEDIYKEETKKTEKERETEGNLAPSLPVNLVPLSPAMQTMYDILTLASAQPLSVDTFLLSYPLWVKAAGGRNLEDLARACIAWHMERGDKVAYPVSAFTTWLDNAKPKKQPGPEVISREDAYWSTTTDYNKLESDHKEYLINAIKGRLYDPGWTPPANTPQKYVDMFNNMKEDDKV